ncbi:FtsK/SpoIIIE family DNA translocase [Zavarzinia aquatilis]|uniref:DNA translocase FtsK n=1 Tax=Zavarzinia aquatilis TaxID=2211142 RepID=A0A317EBC8_9PROT|nr:DNA translocase FtsK 4TM domain-containing protein [Zavarzinia aquatilis]PWR22603.1 cell division protein FtsK [Zavarzinia aquatilis]
MAQTADTTSGSAARRLLPKGLGRALRARSAEILGLALFALATALGLALVSYTAGDASLNVETDAPTRNLIGPIGAYTADFLIQWSGVAAGLLPLILGAWGWRLFSHHGLRHWGLNGVLSLLALVLGAASVNGFDVGPEWPLRSGLGGLVGGMVAPALQSGLSAFGIGLAGGGLSFVLMLLTLMALVFAMGLSLGEWRALGRSAAGASRFGQAGSRWLVSGAQRIFARKSDMPGFALRRADAEREPAPTNAPPPPRKTPAPRRERAEPKFAAAPAGAVAAEVPVRPAPAESVVAEPPPAESRRIVETPSKISKPGKRALEESQAALDLGVAEGEYQLPPLSLLKPAPKRESEAIDEAALETNARLLESVLDDFGVRGNIVKVRPGPVVTLYELEPAPGTKSARVIGLADDIARSMSAISARVSVVPGRNAIGIELPNVKRETVWLSEILSSQEYEKTASALTIALGKDIGGAPVVADLARMPHLLVAGTTGSGKSVAVNTMILSLLYRLPPDQCKLIMVDPKMLELSVYEGIPHLLAPVVTEPAKAVVAMKWAVREMEDRYRKMSRLGVRNIAGYNARIAEAKAKGEELKRTVQTGFEASTGKPIFEEQAIPLEPLPFIVIIVDEFADLMMVAGKDIEGAIQRLAQMARAAGMHLILATQRPSVDVITGTIKANFPTRISFQVTSKIDSRTILGEQGAEQLLGQGDMLYMAGGGRITRVHGPFCSDQEVEDVIAFLKAQGEPDYVEAVTEEPEGMEALEDGGVGGGTGDDLYDKAVAIVAREGKASTSFIQRHLQIGYNRAARIIEQMEDAGIVGKPNHVGKREVLINEAGERVL